MPIKNSWRKSLVLIYSLLIVLLSWYITSCSKKDVDSASNSTTSTIDSSFTLGTAEGSSETGYNASDLVENFSFSNTVSIVFGSTLSITNPLAGNGVAVTQDGADVTIKSTVAAVEYVLSGATSNGSVKIYSDNKFKLTLNGVSITNTNGPAINIQSSKTTFVVVADNTTNVLTDGATYATAPNAEDMKSTLFSEGQMVFSGNGTLSVKGNYKHAICSDDYIRVHSGNISITGSVKDGIHANDAFIADGGTFNITASSDGIDCEEGHIIINDGSFTLNTVDDGIAASYEDADTSIHPYVTINGGTISVKASVGEGIESKSVLTINDGNLSLVTADDGLNAGDAIYINGGNVYAHSTGNDALDSNGIFTITGGKIVAIGSHAPEAGIDCDARTLKITGGILISTGGATSAPSASASTSYSLIMGGASANQLIHIEASDGSEVLTFLIPVSYSTLLFSSSKLKASTTYTVYTGGSVSYGTTFNGLFTSGIYSKGAATTTFTTNSKVTQLGGSISRG